MLDLSQFDGMTPGKWERRGKTIFVEGETALCVAVAEQHKPECAANARAIAALPDLIDELRNTESERAHHAMTAGCLRTDLEYAQSEIARLREVLKAISDMQPGIDGMWFFAVSTARAALEASHDEK